MTDPRVISLPEYGTRQVDPATLTHPEAERIRSRYAGRLAIAYPTPFNGNQWLLESSGWVGIFPVSARLHIRVEPKVPLRNLFGMWDRAYQLQSFTMQDGLSNSSTLEEFYSVLAHELAGRVLERSRRGLAREYVGYHDRLPYLAGRLDAADLARRPWIPSPASHFEEHTADVNDNQLLAWTLREVARNSLCSVRALATVQRAYRAMRNTVAIQPFAAHDCLGRAYTRLTQDYAPMHALCRFFLDHSGPTSHIGDHAMLPFMVDMPRLFELFVAEWLRAHLPAHLRLEAQELVVASAQGDLRYAIDLVIYDRNSGAVACVLDTKYKAVANPASEDINQAVVYATLKQCRTAFLIYPSSVTRRLRVRIGDIAVSTLAFDVSGDLEAAGQQFVHDLLASTLRATAT